MKLLVCGGAGYIGSHMCKLLAESGHEIVVLDDLSTGHEAAVQWGRFYRGSIGDETLLDQIFSQFKPEGVFHFAAKSLVAESVENPATYYNLNVAATLKLLDRIRQSPDCALVFSSTAAVYGKPQTPRINELHPTLPLNPYGRSKLMVEQALRDYFDAYELRSVTFRYFNAAGADPSAQIGEAHEPETHLIPRILESVLGRGERVKVYGQDYPTHDGTCIRDYVHVNDLCRAHLAGFEYLRRHPGSHRFNLGNGHGFSVLEVIDAIQNVVGHKINYEVVDRRLGDPSALVADSAQAHEILGWAPQFSSLEKIIETAWRWHKDKKYSVLSKSKAA